MLLILQTSENGSHYRASELRAHSLYFWSFQKQNREDEGTEQQQQTYQFTQGYNILHRLQVHHLTLTFIIHNKINIYQHYIYIHTYMNCSSQLY